ncbi:MAG: hypothetical protein ACRERR_11935 [Moraxellaceae bacterium]
MSEQIPASPASSVQGRKNKILLLLLLASFVIPFVVGELAYKKHWYKGGATNKGQLLQPPLAFADLKSRDVGGKILDASFTKDSWWMLYVLPADCAAACRNRLFQMRQSPLALGKEGGRLNAVLVVTGPVAAETEALLQKEFAGLQRVEATVAQIDSVLAPAAANASQAGLLYLMDPMGWIMLTYPPEADEKTSIIKAEDALDDLRKMLKNSRIG